MGRVNPSISAIEAHHSADVSNQLLSTGYLLAKQLSTVRRLHTSRCSIPSLNVLLMNVANLSVGQLILEQLETIRHEYDAQIFERFWSNRSLQNFVHVIEALVYMRRFCR